MVLILWLVLVYLNLSFYLLVMRRSDGEIIQWYCSTDEVVLRPDSFSTRGKILTRRTLLKCVLTSLLMFSSYSSNVNYFAFFKFNYVPFFC